MRRCPEDHNYLREVSSYERLKTSMLNNMQKDKHESIYKLKKAALTSKKQFNVNACFMTKAHIFKYQH